MEAKKQADSQKTLAPALVDFVGKTLNIREFDIIPLAGDASTRKYYRVVAGRNSSVLMAWEPFSEVDYPFLSVQSHFAKNQVQVPEVLGVAANLGLVLLEDLGDLTLERKFWEQQTQQMVLPFYHQAIDELLKIHYLASQDRSPCTAFKIAFDEEKFLWEMNYGLEHLFLKMLAVEMKPEEIQELKTLFVTISRRLDKQPKWICHRDYHSRNVMIKLGKVKVIDFQDARMGPVQYDLVSLIKDAYVELNPEMERQILEYYLQHRYEYVSNKLSRDEFDDTYQLQIIQRCFKACGSFASFYNTRGDRRYLKHLSPALNSVHKALSHFPDFKVFKNLIDDLNLLETDFEALCAPSS